MERLHWQWQRHIFCSKTLLYWISRDVGPLRMSQHAAEEIALLWNASLIADEAPPCLSLKLIFPPKKEDWFYILFYKRKKEGAQRGDRAEVTTSQASATVWESNSPLTFNLHTKKQSSSCVRQGMESCVIQPVPWALASYNNTKKNCIVLIISFCFLLRFCFTLEDVNYHCDNHDVYIYIYKKKRTVIKTLIQPRGK